MVYYNPHINGVVWPPPYTANNQGFGSCSTGQKTLLRWSQPRDLEWQKRSWVMHLVVNYTKIEYFKGSSKWKKKIIFSNFHMKNLHWSLTPCFQLVTLSFFLQIHPLETFQSYKNNPTPQHFTPGSVSKCVKCAPFHPQKPTCLEDPGIGWDTMSHYFL